MSAKNFTEEFKIEAVKQVTEQGYPVSEVASRLGVSTNSLYAWVKRYQKPEPQRKQDDAIQLEVKRLRQELKRVTEERDILKKAAVDSICQRNTPFNYLFRCFELQCLSWSVV
jgi:transposase